MILLQTLNPKPRFEYKSHPTDKVLPTESQIRVNTSSDLNVNVSTANMNLFLEAYASWTNLSRIEEGSKQQLIQACMQIFFCLHLFFHFCYVIGWGLRYTTWEKWVSCFSARQGFRAQELGGRFKGVGQCIFFFFFSPIYV